MPQKRKNMIIEQINQLRTENDWVIPVDEELIRRGQQISLNIQPLCSGNSKRNF